MFADCRRTPAVCDLNARCQRRGSEYFCVCMSGYHGDGYDQCTGMRLYTQMQAYMSRTKFPVFLNSTLYWCSEVQGRI